MKTPRFYQARGLATKTSTMTMILMVAATHAMAAPAPLLTDSRGISDFGLYGNGIYWWAGSGRCTGDLPFDATIRVRGTMSGATRDLADDCHLHQGVGFNTVRDEAYCYFFREGVLQRKAVNAGERDGSQIMPSPRGAAQVTLPPLQKSAYLDLRDGHLYWAAFNADTGFATVRRLRTDGTTDPVVVGSVNSGSDVRKLRSFTYRNAGGNDVESLALLTVDGRLYRFNFGAAVIPGPTAGVLDFAIHRRNTLADSTTYIYAAKGAGLILVPANASPGSLVRMDASTGATTTLYTAAGQNQIISVATDSDSSLLVPGAPVKNVYLVEGRVECAELCSIVDASIRRHTLPGSTTGWDLIAASDAGPHLRSDDEYLYCLQSGVGSTTRIMRLRTDAPAIELRIRADALEVVQNSQDLNNSVSLVANKPTFVRAYAHLTTNSTGETTWFPSASLRGRRNGVELPESPLAHLNNAAVDTTANLGTLRADLGTSFFFELPASWTGPGEVTFTFTVNASGGLPETGPAPASDNTLVRSVNFVRKDKPCLVLVPMRTTAPQYNPGALDSGLPQILARARSLLPIEDFRVQALSEPIEKLVFYVEVEFLPCFPLICAVPILKLRYDPFNLQDDASWALFWLTVAHILSKEPAGCADTHWVGTVHRNIPGFNGIGGRSDLTLQDIVEEFPPIPISDFGTGDFSVVRMEPGPGTNPWDSPLGGRTLAHELGHNYGRKHIDQSGLGCGGASPEGPFENYPFNACTIGETSGDNAVFGFDPISETVLPPTVGGDLMSYSATRWISKFTLDAIAQKIGTLGAVGASGAADVLDAPGAAEPPPADAGLDVPLLVINGLVTPRENTASIRPSFVLPPGTADLRKVRRSFDGMTSLGSNAPYRLRMVDALGQSLGEWPLLLAPADDSGRGTFGFVQFVPWHPAAARLQLSRQGTILAEKRVSPHAPEVELSPPVMVANTAGEFIDLAWTATDRDTEPLLFTIQYSPDDGASWQTLRVNHPYPEVRLDSSMLRGSVLARLRVIASDGIRTAIATSARFTVALHPPRPMISGVTENQRIPFGSSLRLEGAALDAEDGSLDQAQLEWLVTGSIQQSFSGSSLSLSEFPPGSYEITLRGTDSHGSSRSSLRRFEVEGLRIPDGTSIVLDGACNDGAYRRAEFARVPLGGGAHAPARMVHADGKLYLSFSDLPYGTAAGPHSVGVRFDVNDSGGATPESGDLGFYVDEHGIAWQLVAEGTNLPITLSPQLGYRAEVVRAPGSWSAELCINDPLLLGWNHGVRLLLHCSRPGNRTDGHWPASASLNSPQSWAPAFLGTPPPAPNRPPVALAGVDQYMPAPGPGPTIVHLDGGSSFDPDRSTLHYAWTQVGGPIVVLNATDTATPHFAAGPPASPVTLRFRLVVNDGVTASAPDEVEVTLRPATSAPAVASTPAHGTRLPDGTFLSAVTVDPEQRYDVQATTNFVDWISLGHALSDFYGILPVIDANAADHPHRFYRGRKP